MKKELKELKYLFEKGLDIIESMQKRENTCRVGDRFKHGSGEEYILAQPEPYKVCLISLTWGNRWCKAVEVEDYDRINQHELDKITYNCTNEFTKINNR